MFIVHGSWLRKYLRWILGGLLLILIPGFVVLFTPADSRESRRQTVPTIRGKPVNRLEWDRAQQAIRAQYLIQTGGELPRSARFEQELREDAIVRVVALRKAGELGIRVTDEELIQYIQSQPVFRNEAGQFDRHRYQQFVLRLNQVRLTEAEFEEVMRQQLVILRLQALVCSAAKATPLEVRQAYEPLHEKITIEYVAFDAADHTHAVTVSEEDVAAFYEKQKAAFRTPEKVKLRYVRVPFDVAAQVVSDADVAQVYERNKAQFTNDLAAASEEIRAALAKSRAQRAAGDRATELTVELVFKPDEPRPDFLQRAAKYNLTPVETGYLTRTDEVAGVTAGPEFLQAAFSLTERAPFSDPVLGQDGYYVIELLDRQRSEILPLAEARPQVVEQLRKQRALEAAVAAGQAAAAKARELVAAGKTFGEVCAELGLTVERAGPFTLSMEKVEIPGDMAVREATLGVAVGGVSPFIRTAQGGVFFHLTAREPPDPAQFEQDQARMTSVVLQRNRETLWNAWLKTILREEQADLGPSVAGPVSAAPQDS
jgi:peptidyl-prolyl cis-trans isomerase D